MKKHKNIFPLISAILFLLTAAVTVGSAWAEGLLRYELGLSFSSYVGLRRWTSVMYFIVVLMIMPLLVYYVAKTEMPKVKRYIYWAVFLCIFACAFFPFNDSPSGAIHNWFAIGLMLAVTVLFVMSVILAKCRKQRIIAICCLIYAAVFTVMFFTGFEPMFKTFFIWEVTFIMLLLVILNSERIL